MTRIVCIVTAIVAALSLSGCCCCCLPSGTSSSEVARNLSAGPVVQETREVELAGVDQVQIALTYGGGDLDIVTGADKLLRAEFVYNVPDLKPLVAYESLDGQGVLEIRHQVESFRWDSWDKAVRNEWKLDFSDQVPVRIKADVGASTGKWELGGLRITDLDLTAGAADITVQFDQPNPEQLDSMRVKSGAARLQLLELGNANLSEFYFDGGLGTYTFGFGGEWQRSARAEITAGASELTLRLPRNIGVRVCPGDLRHVDDDGLERLGECYVNQLYNESEITLDVDVELGLGRLVLRQE